MCALGRSDLLTIQEIGFIGSRCATDRENREWELENIRALRDLAEIVLDEIASRLEMAKRQAAEQRKSVSTSSMIKLKHSRALALG